MNQALRTTLAIAVLSTLAPSQHVAAAADPRLTRLQLIEEQEGDLRAAEAGYRALLEASDAEALHAETSLRLGTLLWRLDRRADATPFLEAAASAGGTTGDAATKVLQGQGDSDKAAQERLVRARALTARLDGLLMSERHPQAPLSPAEQEELTKAMAAATKELTFLGDAAATALVERLRELRRAMAGPAAVEKDGRIVGLASRLWRVGTEPARLYLAEVAADPVVEWRRAIVAPCASAADDLLPAVDAFARDADPTGDVPNAMNSLARRVPTALLTRFVTDGNGQVRALGWSGIGDQWPRLPAPEQDAVLAAVGDRFVDAATGDDLRTRAACARLARGLVIVGPAAGRRLVLRLLAKGGDPGDFGTPAARAFQLDDEAIAELAGAGRALGPCPTLSKGTDGGPAATVATILEHHEPLWSEVGVASLVELVELGYARFESTNARWPSRFARVATGTQTARLLRALPRVPDPKPILEALTRQTSGQGAYPAAREAFEAGLRGETAGWRLSQPVADAKLGVTEVEAPTDVAWRLSSLAGRSDDPAATTWLVEVARQMPLHAGPVVNALLSRSIAADHEPTRAAMRTLLTATGPSGPTLSREGRAFLFFELVRLGDVPAIPLLPEALRLGVDTVAPFRPTTRPTERGKAHPLAAFGPIDGAIWHHYDEPHLVAAWQALLNGAPVPTLDFLTWAEVEVPVGALPPLVRFLPAAEHDQNDQERWNRIWKVALHLRNVRPADVEASADLRGALQEVIGGPDDTAALAVIDGLQDDVLQSVADLVRTRIKSVAEPGGVLVRLLRCGVALSIEEWRLVLRGTAWRAALADPPTKPAPEFKAEVTAMLESNSAEQRAVACSTLACWMDETSVAPLLNALRDPAKEVRAAAADALQRIRFHREQDAFWSGAENRVDTSTAGAAAKLIAQALPAAPRAQRLLAIRSLGTLGAAEALPYLIEWTGDTDAEVAATSRAAIEAIQKKAETVK